LRAAWASASGPVVSGGQRAERGRWTTWCEEEAGKPRGEKGWACALRIGPREGEARPSGQEGGFLFFPYFFSKAFLKGFEFN